MSLYAELSDPDLHHFCAATAPCTNFDADPSPTLLTLLFLFELLAVLFLLQTLDKTSPKV
jgi:hypothetical protein